MAFSYVHWEIGPLSVICRKLLGCMDTRKTGDAGQTDKLMLIRSLLLQPRHGKSQCGMKMLSVWSLTTELFLADLK